MTSPESPSDQHEQLGSLRGLIADATKDTALWLRSDCPTEQQGYVLAMQERLNDLARIVERRGERRSSPTDDRDWSATISDLLSLFERARQVRGNVVGNGLARLAEHLVHELPGRVMVEESADLSNIRNADPVIGNPFPSNNLRHEIWKRATLKAEEEHCLQTAQAVRNRPSRQGFREWYERGGNLREFEHWVLNLHAERFNIWARRACQVVLDERDLGIYDGWLSTYAKDYLRLVTASGTARDWPTGTCYIPAEFEAMLLERVNYCKALARRFLRYYRAEVEKLTEQAPAQNTDKTAQSVRTKVSDVIANFGDVLTGVGGASESSPKTERRAGWIAAALRTEVKDENPAARKAALKKSIGKNIQRLRKECGWSLDMLVNKTGIDKKQILAHEHARSKPRPKTLREYAQAFSKELNRSITANNLEE